MMINPFPMDIRLDDLSIHSFVAAPSSNLDGTSLGWNSAAVVSKTGEDVFPSVITMLETIIHRGVDAHGISSANFLNIGDSIRDIERKHFSSNIAIGYDLSRILKRDYPQPIRVKTKDDEFSYIFEGRLYPNPEVPETERMLSIIQSNPQKNFDWILRDLNGSFNFAVALRDQLIVGRDVCGILQLYVCENDELYAIASERKAVWSLGITDVECFPPCSLAIIKEESIEFRLIRSLTKNYQINEFQKDRHKNIEFLHKILRSSIKNRLSDLDHVAIAFSGGLDSSIIAFLAKTIEIVTHLIAVGLQNQPEILHSMKAAESLDLPINIRIYKLSEVQRVLPKVAWLIEDPDPLKMSISIPIYWVAELAASLKYNVLFAGHGSDELFGGYKKYLNQFLLNGAESTRKTIIQDVSLCYEKIFQRDNQICSFYNIELRFPFFDPEIIDFALSLPMDHLFFSSATNNRKRILRELARTLDIPLFISDRPKKTIQYSTGVTKALRRLAKNHGLSIRKFLHEIFQQVYLEKKTF